jgi:hypothetical protein
MFRQFPPTEPKAPKRPRGLRRKAQIKRQLKAEKAAVKEEEATPPPEDLFSVFKNLDIHATQHQWLNLFVEFIQTRFPDDNPGGGADFNDASRLYLNANSKYGPILTINVNARSMALVANAGKLVQLEIIRRKAMPDKTLLEMPDGLCAIFGAPNRQLSDEVFKSSVQFRMSSSGQMRYVPWPKRDRDLFVSLLMKHGMSYTVAQYWKTRPRARMHVLK